MEKMTQAEADRLLNMLKRTLIETVLFPKSGAVTDFKIAGDTNRDVFVVHIRHSEIRKNKYEFHARVLKDSVLLLQLHIGDTLVHQNPDGEKITGSHWHIYKEGYNNAWAFPADDFSSDKFVENTIAFLEKFNVIELPNILYQMELT